MRIAYICADPGVPVFGWKGCSVHVQEVICALVRLGRRVELFASRFEGDLPAVLEKVRLHRLPALPRGELARREAAALAANRDLRAALERAGRFDLIYERLSLWSFAGMQYARATGVPGLLEVNAPLIEEQEKHRGLVDRTSAEWVREQAFGAATLLVAVSEEIAGYLKRCRAARGKVVVVPNGVNPDRFPAGLRASCPGPPGTFTVGFLGTLKPWHAVGTLVEAFAILHGHHPEIRLLIVGDGTKRASLKEDLARRGLLDSVHFTGAVAPTEVPGLLASMDVGVAPYPKRPHFYFSPLKVYEYMAAGLPVVASQIGQLAELIHDRVNGLLCPPEDAVALARALDRLRGDPELRAQLGQAARAAVIRDHTWDAVAGRILELAGSDRAPQLDRQEVRS